MKKILSIISALAFCSVAIHSLGQSITVNSTCVGNTATIGLSGCTVPGSGQWHISGFEDPVPDFNAGTSSAPNYKVEVTWVVPGSFTITLDSYKCGTGAIREYHGSYTVNVSSFQTPSVVISGSSAYCNNNPSVFTATALNAGTTPSYTWKVNNTAVAGTSTNSWRPTSPLRNGDVITVSVQTGGGSCFTQSTANSANSIAIFLTDPTSSVLISGPAQVCTNKVATFNVVSVTNGGSAPVYHWFVGGSEVNNGEGGVTIANGGARLNVANWSYAAGTSVSCSMLSNSSCRNPGNVSSNAINVSIQSPATLTASLARTESPHGGNIYCMGEEIIFTASANIPATYSWRLYGGAIGTGATLSIPTTSIVPDYDGVNNSIQVVVSSISSCVINPTTTVTYPLTSLTIYSVPDPPGVSDQIIPYNTGVLLTPTGANARQSYNWYDASGVFLEQGIDFETPVLKESTTYLISISSETIPCLSSQSSLTVSVNHPPVIDAGADIVLTAPVGATSITGSASDADGSISSYRWSQVSGPALNLSGVTTSTMTVTKPPGGIYLFRLTATDNLGLAAFDEMQLTVKYPISQINFVRDESITAEQALTSTDVDALTVDKKITNTSFLDGLGRIMQSVNRQGSPLKKDVVVPMVYDAFGREVKKYLPFTSSETNGDLKYDPVNANGDYSASSHHSFYNTSMDAIANDDSAYVRTVFEPSPLNRVREQGSTGAAWQPIPSSSAGHTIKKVYRPNGSGEVYSFGYDLSAGQVTTSLGANQYFAANQLQATVTTDEHQNEVIEFVDKRGHTICTKVQYAGTGSAKKYAATYYIYDDLDNLVAVLSPEAVRQIVGNVNTQSAYAFMYKYDTRRRMSQKKVPDADWVYLVYDDRDRLVMTQDGNQRATSTRYWSFTKYDQFNRPILTGVWSTTASYTQESMQAVVDAYYIGEGPAKFYETYIGNAVGNVHGYSNNSFPNSTSSAGETDPFKYLSVTYYDNYSFTNLLTRDYSYVPESIYEIANGVTYRHPLNSFTSVSGQVTGRKMKVLDGGVTGGYTWLNTVNYYDRKYRVIQILADNYKGGTDRISNVLDFAGRVLKTKATHVINGVTWTDLTNVQQLGNKLIGFPPSSWTAGAASREVLPAGADGWLEFTVTEPSRKIVGFNDSNAGGTIASDIDYSFQLNNGGLTVQQGSVVLASVGTVSPGDVLRIERKGTTITFRRNGTIIPFNPGKAPMASTTSLVVDNSFYLSGSTIAGVRTSFSQKSRTITRRFTYDHAGRLLKVMHKVGDEAEVILLQNEYNEVGQLIDKKLHSVASSAFKQSIDYRYNIRGWITSINNSQLAINDTNDDANDLFGVNLGYERPIGTSNSAMFNGNISAMKWSKNMALISTSKDIAYNYAYDTLNRLKGAQLRTNTSGIWANANAFSESNYRYDLNGNILSLMRNDSLGTTIDNLTYNYGPPGVRSNRLLSVTDASDDNAGFKEVDSSNKLDDYAYDSNGNMVWDRNKGGMDLVKNGNFDGGNANWTLTDTNNRVSFATVGQATFVAGSANAVLKQSGIIKPNAPHVLMIEIIRTSNTGSINVSVGGAGTVITGGSVTISVTAGTSADFAMTASTGFAGYIKNVSVRGLTVISYNLLNLPEQVSNASNSTMQYIYDAQGKKLAQNVYGRVTQVKKATDYVGEFVYQNDTLRFINTEEGRVIMTGSSPEYQYHLTDHLGNVRVTFTSRNDIVSDRGTVETDSIALERSKFLNVENARRINARLFDHTYNGATPANGAYSTRLTGSDNEKIGLAKSLSVMPGDRIEAEVFAKYVDPTATNDNAMLSVLSAIASGKSVSPGVYIDGAGYASAGTTSYPFKGLFTPAGSGTAPKAYLNYVTFDRSFNLIDHGFKQISTAARETGDVSGHSGLTYEGISHERLAFEGNNAIQIKEPGYIYIWLSNEESTPVEVFFDDFKVTHSKSPVVQMNDYYPFGLTYNSYSRENAVPNKTRLFQGQEHVDDLGLSWDSFKWRNHMPDIGRFFNVDKLSEKYYYNSPYAFSENKVVSHKELEGLEAWSINYDDNSTGTVNGPFKNQRAAEAHADNQLIRSPLTDPVITSEVDANRMHPVNKVIKPHNGVDMVKENSAETDGAPVVAPLNGVVIDKGSGDTRGNFVVVKANKDGKKHVFFHMQDGSTDVVTVNSLVNRGDQVGSVGNTGASTGPHLHYEVRGKNGAVLLPRVENPSINGETTDKNVAPKVDRKPNLFPGQVQ